MKRESLNHSRSAENTNDQQRHFRGAELPPPRFIAGFFICILLLAAIVVAPPCSAQNRVLELDGNGSYVELPPNIFRDLTQATVEVWAKWDRFANYSRVFEFGSAWQSMSLFNQGTGPDLRFNLYPKKALNNPALTFNARANGLLQINDWVHIAAVSGPGGMKLYANGILVATHTNEACLAQINTEHTNLLGRGLVRNPDDKDFRGQLDEIRVWNYRRTEAQLRDNMHRRLTGAEEGLVGLWNFDAGLATDATQLAHHGKLIGQARIVTPDLPAALVLVSGESAPPATPVPAVAGAPAVPAPGNDLLYWWIAGTLSLIVSLLACLVLMMKRYSMKTQRLDVAVNPAAPGSASPQALNAPANPSAEMKERALAELTEFAKQSLVQGLYSQRNALLETQQKAQRELVELEARLIALKLPDRIQAYEKRIMELEHELEIRTGEVRELTSATLLLMRQKVEEERQLERATRRFN